MTATLGQALAFSYGNQEVLIDTVQAIELFKVLAEQQQPHAFFELALFYDHDRGDCMLPLNLYYRDQYLLRAARLGHTQAIIMLFSLMRGQRLIFNTMYYDEDDIDQLYDELQQITDQLIAQGNTQALLIKGKYGVSYPDLETIPYLYQAWQQGEKLSASLYLSQCDDEELQQLGLYDAETWSTHFERAQHDLMRELEHALQQGQIQKIVEFLRSDVSDYISEQNRAQLWQWRQLFYQQQADWGAADAWLQLSRMTETYVDYLKTAAALKHPVAMYAYAYELDRKTDLSDAEFEEIEHYFTLAAEHKHAQALYEKGRYYTEDEPEQAKHYFKQAAEFGCLEAIEWLVALTEQHEQAQWAELALQYGSIDHKVKQVLIVALRGGLGILENHQLADELQLSLELSSQWDRIFSLAVPAAAEHYETQVQPQIAALFDENAEQPKLRQRLISGIKKWLK